MTNVVPIITIDGPSGTGKGTLCHLLGHHLKWHILDSGALYRVLAYAAKAQHLSMQDPEQLAQLASHLDLHFLDKKVFLNQEDVTIALRQEQCGQNASKIAAYPLVREALLMRQRAFAQFPGLVTDGRDMGTVVFKQALLKIYLDASVEARAKRRFQQLEANGAGITYEAVVAELEQRDERDRNRSHAPLKPAEDAVVIDTTGLTIAQVFDHVVQLAAERLHSV